MTREDAIKILNTVLLLGKCDCPKEEIEECLKMAIKALEQEIEKPYLDRLKVDIENEIRFWQEPSKYGNADKRVRVAKVTSYKHMLELIESINALEQEPKKGHWMPTYGNVKCSVCGSVKDSREVGRATHYCDFCGAKMESEDK